MEILFDNVIFSKEKQGGISNCWYHLVKKYENDKNAFFYEEKNAADNIFRKQLRLNNVVGHRQLPVFLARLSPIHYTAHTNYMLYHSSFYRKLVTNARVCEVTTIHDFLHNKYSTPIKRALHNHLKYSSIKRSAGIICVSNNTMKDLKKYCSIKTSQKVTLIYNGVSDDYKPVEKESETMKAFFKSYDLTGKFLLFVGARSRYKNFDFVVSLLAALPAYKLVVVGNALSENEKKMIGAKLMDRIVVASNISNTALNYFYNCAQALIYPSYYEGFGIPVIESMKAGCPVLALDISSIPEVAGGAAQLFDKPNIFQFVKEITQLENLDYRKIVITNGLNNAKRFSWDKYVAETTAFYEEVYNSSI